jgi:hydrogenase nickel incorporation protein HypA/HybF
MHELGIAQEMLKVALEVAAKNNATRITAFNIEISAAADESEDSLRFHFEHLTRGTIAEGAQIAIIQVPVKAKCLACGADFDWEVPETVCPRCSGAQVRAVLPGEFRLVSIDAE